jgi:hypothetical protein
LPVPQTFTNGLPSLVRVQVARLCVATTSHAFGSHSDRAVTHAGCQDKPTARATRLGGNTQSHRHRGVPRRRHRTRAGQMSRSWQRDATTSRWRSWPNPRFGMFRLVQHEREETGMHSRYLWARHPAIAGGSVHHVRAVSSRGTPSPLSRRRAALNPAFITRLTTTSKTQRPSPRRERA